MTYNQLTKGRYSAVEQEYFVTFTTANREPVLCDYNIGKIVAQTIHQQNSVYIWAWVIMPDHVHILMTLKNGSLSGSIQAIKGKSSRAINQACHKFKWAKGYYDRALRKEEERIEVARYIVANPLRAGLTRSLRYYPWWDAAFL